MHRFSIFIALVAVFGCASVSHPVSPQPDSFHGGAVERVCTPENVQVEWQDGVLRYRGEMTEDGLAALKYLAAGKEARALEIDSAGGEILVGMDFGLWVHERGLDVTVARACLSSCANYVFPAGRHKFIQPGAVVAWHGSARQEGLLEQLDAAVDAQIAHRALPAAHRERELAHARQANRTYLTDAILKEGAFFHRIGVDEYVTRIGNEAYGVRGFFYLSVEDMARLGIDKVSAPEDYARMEPRALTQRAGFPVTYVKLKE